MLHRALDVVSKLDQTQDATKVTEACRQLQTITPHQIKINERK